MATACLSMIVVGLAVGCPLTWLVRGLGRRLGHLDEPGGRKAHARAVPATGGIAMFAAVVGPMLAAIAGAWWIEAATWRGIWPSVVEHLPGLRAQTPMALGLIGCLATLHIVGVIDDRRGLGPFVKLIVELIAAGVIVIVFNVRLLELLETYLGPAGLIGSYVLTIGWFIVITNAFNFLDNMDGLSGGVALICCGVLLAASLLAGQWFIAGLLSLLIGALLGFLVFNFPPASIFMGDGGSLLIGFAIAFCSIRVTYYEPDVTGGWWGMLTPLVVLAIPLYDLTSVTLIRLAQGRSPFMADTQHFSHRLVRKGLTRRSAVIVIYACTLATALGGVVLARLDEAWAAVLIAVQTASVLVVLALLERTGTPTSAPTDRSP